MDLRVLKEDQLMLIADECGDVPRGRRRLGLYHRDTRYLSVFELTLNGQSPRHLASSCRQNAVCDIRLANPTINIGHGAPVVARTIGVQRSRFLHDGLHERITLYNYNRFPVRLDLALLLGADFLDIYEVRGFRRARRGKIARPKLADSEVTFAYSGLDAIRRFTRVVFETPPSSLAIEARGRAPVTTVSAFLPESTDVTGRPAVRPPTAKATWNLTLEPREPLQLTLHILPATNQPAAARIIPFERDLSTAPQRFEDWCGQCTRFATNNEMVDQLLKRSQLDLGLLLESTPDGLVPDAGIPWFGCFYGSQSAIVSLQTLALNPLMAVHTLRHLARHQGREVNPEREEEPGKIVHEMRAGELAGTGETPHAAFYGGIDATPLFLILFAETMKWLDDDGLYRDILPAATLALEWLFRYGDADGDGYIEYRPRPAGGNGQQRWLDDRGMVIRAGGTMAEEPVALAVVQGYAYRAMKEMGALLERKGDRTLAQTLAQKAAALKQRFNDDFWLEDQRYFAQALDGRKKPVPNITSTVGRCLFCDIIDEDKARYVVTRLSSPEMASGWGIRNLSNRAENYNPMSYRHGSVWPQDNSLIVAGMKRYGCHWEMEEISSQVFDASTFLPHRRLPELFAGFRRDAEAYSIPAEYPASCSPHAGASGSVFLLIQSLLGLQAEAAARRIYLSPRLPKWLHRVSVENLRVGDKTVSLRFDRVGDDEETRFEISDNEAGLEVVVPPR